MKPLLFLVSYGGGRLHAYRSNNNEGLSFGSPLLFKKNAYANILLDCRNVAALFNSVQLGEGL